MKLTGEEWDLIAMALHYAAEWEKTLADSFNVRGYEGTSRLEALDLERKYRALRSKLLERKVRR